MNKPWEMQGGQKAKHFEPCGLPRLRASIGCNPAVATHGNPTLFGLDFQAPNIQNVPS